MKTFLVIALFLCTSVINNVFSYDAKIKDKYGRVTGYVDQQGDKTHIVDKYGKRGDYIESDGTIKDKYGRMKGKIEEND